MWLGLVCLSVLSGGASSAVAQALPPYRVAASGAANSAYFEVNSMRSDTAGSGQSFAGFVTPGGGGDSLFQFGWFYRISGDASNSAFNDDPSTGQSLSTPPQYVQGQVPSGLQVGTMSFGWTNVDNRGFDAAWSIGVSENGPDRAVAQHTMELSNPSAADLVIELFYYVDADVDGAFQDGDARTAPGSQFIVTDSRTRSFLDIGVDPAPSGWEVDSFSGGLAGRMIAGAYDLVSAGLPFVPGDWTGAMQWSLTIPPGQTRGVQIEMGRNECASPVPTSAAVSHYGVAVGGASGPPRVNAMPARVGEMFRVFVGNGPANGSATLFIGGTALNLPFCSLWIQVASWTNATVPLDLIGSGSLELATPCDSNLFGVGVFVQAFAVDPTSPSACFPVVHSSGLQMTLGN